MVKRLHDLCLICITKNLQNFSDLPVRLPTVHKELLIKRLAYHDLLYETNIPYVVQNVFCSSLRTIVFYKCHQVTDDLLEKLARSRCRLQFLNIHGCQLVTDVGIESITRDQTELEILELIKLPLLTSSCFNQLKSQKLWKVNLKNCTNLKTEGVKILTANNPSIRVLILGGKTGVDSTVYQHVAQNLQDSLEEFDACLHTTNDVCLNNLSLYCPNLRKLNLEGCTRIGKDALIKLFQGCTRLEDLDLSYCNKLRDYPDNEVLWILPKCLTDLTICGLLLDNQTIFVESLERLTRLRSVHLCGVTALNDETLSKVLEKIGKDLVLLDVSGYGGFTKNLTDVGVAAISKYCHNLESLKISMLADVTGETLIPLFQDRKRASKIVNLSVNCKQTSLKVIYLVVQTCINLQKFDLGGVSGVTNDVIFSLVENCFSLNKISLKGCRLITDSALIELARCCPLKSLVLSGINNLTDASIFALANSCHDLEEIYLNGCAHVSSAAVHYLTDCCINRLYVQHATPNAQPYQLMAKNLDTGEFCRADLLQFS
ncbi:F-box/LRR-repeat protein 20 [Patella vulgata]|uniref:F-box/LRR-repeat protein 20 n=1 Tax=Patella vulgata TaxID=6465 RepID=UPI00217F286D|nr:F-box/LRR-repeat protein 20 [Patella vulgata]